MPNEQETRDNLTEALEKGSRTVVMPLEVLRDLASPNSRPDVTEFVRAHSARSGDLLVQVSADTIQFV